MNKFPLIMSDATTWLGWSEFNPDLPSRVSAVALSKLRTAGGLLGKVEMDVACILDAS